MSKTEIVNRALLKLGEPPVSSLNDAAFGKSYETIYEDVKNLLLSSYPWRFAVACKHLAREEELYGERYRYLISELMKECSEQTMPLCAQHLKRIERTGGAELGFYQFFAR